MSAAGSSIAVCGCASGSHEHTLGACPNIATELDGLCATCHERADADTFGGGTLGSFAVTKGSPFPSQEAFDAINRQGDPSAGFASGTPFDDDAPDTGTGNIGTPAYGTGAYGTGTFGGTFGTTNFNGANFNNLRFGPDNASANPSSAKDEALTPAELAEGLARIVAALPEIPAPSPKPTASTAISASVQNSIEATMQATAIVVPPIWGQNGVEALRLMDNLERDLRSLRALAENMEAAKAAERSHNNPPGLVEDAPEIDVAALDAALATIPVLRSQVIRQDPDPQILEVIWRTLLVGARTVGRFAAWVAVSGAKTAARYLDNIFDSATKSFGASIGTPHGFATWGALACGIAAGPDNDLKLLIEIVKAVRVGLGYH